MLGQQHTHTHTGDLLRMTAQLTTGAEAVKPALFNSRFCTIWEAVCGKTNKKKKQMKLEKGGKNKGKKITQNK